MTAEPAIVWNDNRTGADLALLPGGNLVTAPPLQTAIFVSLFTDARAKPDDLIAPGEVDRRGWWGEQIDDESIGSRLWLLRRAKRLPDTLQRAEDYTREALQWLIAADIVARFDVVAAWIGAVRINLTITAHRVDGTRETVNAAWAWQGN